MKKFALIFLACVVLLIGIQVARVAWYQSVIEHRKVIETTVEVTTVVTATPEPTATPPQGVHFQRYPYTPPWVTIAYKTGGSFNVEISGAVILNIEEKGYYYQVSVDGQIYNVSPGSVIQIEDLSTYYWVLVGAQGGGIQLVKPVDPLVIGSGENGSAELWGEYGNVAVLEISGKTTTEYVPNEGEVNLFEVRHITAHGDILPIIVEGTPSPIGAVFITPVPTVPVRD